MKMELSNRILLTAISLSVIAVIVSTGYKFLWLKDYNFIVEAECDPNKENCFYRDCSESDSCPPNNLENYRTFSVRASDFYGCSNSSCLTECTSGIISCHEIICGETEEDECSIPEQPQKSFDDVILNQGVEAVENEDEIEI